MPCYYKRRRNRRGLSNEFWSPASDRETGPADYVSLGQREECCQVRSFLSGGAGRGDRVSLPHMGRQRLLSSPDLPESILGLFKLVSHEFSILCLHVCKSLLSIQEALDFFFGFFVLLNFLIFDLTKDIHQEDR